MKAQVRRLGALTGLRFVAAGAVVLYHTAPWAPEEFGALKFFGSFLLGQAAVGFFFVLSGFILTYVYPYLGSGGEAGRFLLARVARLYPAHLFGLLLSMAVTGSILQPCPLPALGPLGLLAAHAALVQSWYPGGDLIGFYNSPAWSISTELGFYLFFVLLIQNWGRTWWWKLPLAVAVPVAVVAAVNAYGWQPTVRDRSLSYDQFLCAGPAARVWEFALGMATALAWRRFEPGLRVGVALGTALELAALGLFAAAAYYAAPVGRAAGAVPWLGAPAELVLTQGTMLVAPPSALLVFVMASEWGLVSRLLRSRPAVFLGEISYAMYIVHYPLMIWLLIHRAAFAGTPGWQVWAAYWAGLLLLSCWVYAAVEGTARRAIAGLWPAPGARPLAPAPRPGRAAWLAAGGGAILMLAGAASDFVARQTCRVVAPTWIEALTRHALPHSRGVTFGDIAVLRGATFRHHSSGVDVRLVWQSLREQPPGFKLWLQGCGPPPAELGEWSVPDSADLGLGGKPIPPGFAWEQRVFVSREQLARSDRVTLIVWAKDDKTYLPISGGPLDVHGRLLLHPSPPPAGGGVDTPAGGR